MNETETENVNAAEVEMPTVVTQEMLDANPELVAAGVEVGAPIGEATDEEVADAIQNGTPVIVEPIETQPEEPAVVEETPAPAEPVVEPVVENTTATVGEPLAGTLPEVAPTSEEKKTELEPSNEVGTLPNTTKEQFVSYVEKLKVSNPEEYLRKKDYLDKVLIAYNQ